MEVQNPEISHCVVRYDGDLVLGEVRAPTVADCLAVFTTAKFYAKW